LHGARGGGAFAAVAVTIAVAFAGAGLAARRRRPASRTGLLMIAAGLAWTGTSLNHAVAWPGAAVGATLWAGVVLHLVLAFPDGRHDGRGGADEQCGSGLRALTDRVGALGGRLECRSPARGGTLLRAEIPCAS
jgi:hypothetical protein